MVNYCIQTGLEKGITSRFRLSREVYHKLMEYGCRFWCLLGAIEVAASILKNHRKVKRKRKVGRPCARKLMAELGKQAFKVSGSVLIFPLKPRHFIEVPLHRRALEVLRCVKHGLITVTPKAIHIAYSHVVEVRDPKGWVAVDVNEDNITAVSSDGDVKVYDLPKLESRL